MMRWLLGLGVAVALLCSSVYGQQFAFESTLDSRDVLGFVDLGDGAFSLSMSPVAAGTYQFIGSETFIGLDMTTTVADGITTLFGTTPEGSALIEIDDLTSLATITLMQVSPPRTETFDPIQLQHLSSSCPVPEPQSYLFPVALGALWLVRRIRG